MSPEEEKPTSIEELAREGEEGKKGVEEIKKEVKPKIAMIPPNLRQKRPVPISMSLFVKELLKRLVVEGKIEKKSAYVYPLVVERLQKDFPREWNELAKEES